MEGKPNMRSSIPHDESMIALYRDDPDFAAYMLDEALKEGDQAEVMLTMRRIADAHGGVGMVSDASKITRNSLYKTLSDKGNPVFSNLTVLLKAMGLRLSVQRIEQPNLTA
jgi:probable addiction module antidote protein